MAAEPAPAEILPELRTVCVEEGMLAERLRHHGDGTTSIEPKPAQERFLQNPGGIFRGGFRANIITEPLTYEELRATVECEYRSWKWGSWARDVQRFHDATACENGMGA